MLITVTLRFTSDVEINACHLFRDMVHNESSTYMIAPTQLIVSVELLSLPFSLTSVLEAGWPWPVFSTESCNFLPMS